MKINPMHGLLGLIGAGAGLWYWNKQKEKSGAVNYSVLNNPPPQDAKASPLLYSSMMKPIVGQQLTIFESTGHPVGNAVVYWVQTLEPGMKAPTIAVRTVTGERWFVKPGAVA